MASLNTPLCDFGWKAIDFNLEGVDGTYWNLEKAKGPYGLVVMFICNHCPYVIHIREALGRLSNEFQPKGISFVAINSNDVSQYPDDAPEKMPSFAKAGGWDFPYLIDSSQSIAHAWHAACTPDFFILNEKGILVYAGQFDSTRPKSEAVATGQDLRSVLEALLSNRPIPSPQIPSLGCNIKWKPGNEPKN
jgi:peroxiredoxin